jgi:hypothetical protein
MFRLVLAEGRGFIAQRDREPIHRMLKDNTDYHFVPPLSGNGPINALTILAEAGDLGRFGIIGNS